MVGPVTVAPGKVNAAVQGSRPRPYRSSVHLPVLTDPQWDTLLDTIAARAGHLAALLDDEMPAELVDDARHAGVPLLPLPTELDPECSCPDWGYPCKHAAALCYAIAATIGTDPFVLFALRGRGREEVFAQLRALRTAAQETAAPPAPGRHPGRRRVRPLGRRAPRTARTPGTRRPHHSTARRPATRHRPGRRGPGTPHGRRHRGRRPAPRGRHRRPAPDPAPGRRPRRRKQPRSRVVPPPDPEHQRHIHCLRMSHRRLAPRASPPPNSPTPPTRR
nr:SWIM zinc finger family protein [Streptomyces dysideae]